MIDALFSQNGWQYKVNKQNSAYKSITISDAHVEYNINVYSGNLRNEKRSLYEKKIQLSSLDPREKLDEFTIILGIYVFNKDDKLKDIIVVAYPVEPNIKYDSNPSLRGVFVDKTLYNGKKKGLYVDTQKKIVAFRPEFIFYYLDNYKEFHHYQASGAGDAGAQETSELINLAGYPRNRIVFGAPGTGKSFLINEEKNIFENNYERVTFHPSYSYAQFMGTYKPKPKVNDADQTEYISYGYVAGPFLRIWINAHKFPDQGFLLIIEEINRANVASVFGDIFQLLDRNSEGESEYAISTSEDVRDYLVKEHSFDPESEKIDKLTIPPNLYIWATMNSADQGVFPMDAAFKRRWHFEYLSIDHGSDDIKDITIKLTPYGEIQWNLLRTKINNRLTESGLNINEDKLIGPFFLNSSELTSTDINGIVKNKLLLYLFEDVLKHRKGSLFQTQYNTFSKIIEAYDRGENVFDFEVE